MNILAGKTKYEFGVNRILNETNKEKVKAELKELASKFIIYDRATY